MLRVKIIGFDCPHCQLVKKIAAEELTDVLRETPDLKITLEHGDDVTEVQKYHIFYTLGLVVNEKLVCAGRVPSKQEVLGWLRGAITDQNK
ncbi:MAG TPA: thioredoxin family protein [Anaerolineales bacterium]|nr:thioredoxin family protein [Anaerolineales bacterium]